MAKQTRESSLSRQELRVPREQAVERLNRQVAAATEMEALATGNPTKDTPAWDELYRKWSAWGSYNNDLIEALFTVPQPLQQEITSYLGAFGSTYSAREIGHDIRRVSNVLTSIAERSQLYSEPIAPAQKASASTPAIRRELNAMRPIDRVEHILSRFHVAAVRLRKRRTGRTPFVIEDEHDVQYLLGAMFKIDVDDMRDEEWTPSYAGGSSRMDFVLKKEHIVVEVKMTRDGLGDKEVGEQLLVDIAKYRTHADCKTLVCFIYDPDHRIANRPGLRDDLEATPAGELKVVVRFSPST